MDVVLAIERDLGNDPRDVGVDKLGYDVESREPDGRLRFIEVKGRVEGSTTVTVTRNEIMKSLNVPDRFILAIVEVKDGKGAGPMYVRRPFAVGPDPAATSVNYSIRDLLAQGELVESYR